MWVGMVLRSVCYRCGCVGKSVWNQSSEFINSFINLCFFLGYEEDHILCSGLSAISGGIEEQQCYNMLTI